MSETTSSPPVPGNGSGMQSGQNAESLTRLIAPIFAGFSLPTIINFASSKYPGAPWHDVVLSLLIAATGLFMASIQMSIGRLYETYDKYPRFRSFRASLTILGIVLVALSLTFLAWPVVGRWWIWLPLGVLLIGGIGPGAWMLIVRP
ncbi:MAG TPA: hypothetical protein VIX86_25140, partial [Streptosporangiaceae bacterium]